MRYLAAVPVDAVGLDWMIDLAFARDHIQKQRPIQGNLDPVVLLCGGAALDRAVDAIVEAFASGPFIFNLGHGIVPGTPVENVQAVVKMVKEFRLEGARA